ncbi:phage major capsid protein [Segeticoccus rhizosphaerae]|uniref:phage major capsid protein n=1 Tax=Segeticoccus rhizosphaerae TaxID=1104777 RepID=UPI0010C14406|nr:phage major capsid protein [Ornithinicoccus soli]
MVADTTSTASLIQEQVSSLLVQPLEAASVVLAAGPRIFDSSEPLRIPKITAGITAGFVAENAEIPEGDVAFGEIMLMPSDRKSIKAITKFSNEALRQSTVGLDAVLKARLVHDVAAALDSALLTGTGTTKSITGITKQTGVSTGVLDATSPDSILDALGTAAANEVEPNRLFVSSADFTTLRKVKASGTGEYMVQPDVTGAARYQLFGVPVTVTNKLPTGTAVLADMSQVAVVRDLAPSVTVLSERYAEFDQQAIRVVTRYDLGLLHPEGVVVLTAVAP